MFLRLDQQQYCAAVPHRSSGCLLYTFEAAATCQQQSLRLRLLFIFGAAATYQEQSLRLRLLFTFRAAATCQQRLNLRLLFLCSMSSS